MDIREVFKRQIDTRDENSVHPMSGRTDPLVYAIVKSAKGSLLVHQVLDSEFDEFEKNHTLMSNRPDHFPVFKKIEVPK
jgi:hypothetical protein